MVVAVICLSMSSQTTSMGRSGLATQYTTMQVLTVTVAFTMAVVAGALAVMYTATTVAVLVGLVTLRAGGKAVSRLHAATQTDNDTMTAQITSTRG